MPEGDTVHLAARRLDAALGGRTLCRTDFRVPRLATTDLAGRRVEGVASRGKHILIRIEGGLTLHTHYRMEGSWHLYRPGERWRGTAWQVRAVLETERWIAVGFRLPVVELLASSEEAQVVGHLGPDPLAADWDAGEALRRLIADPSRPVGEALLDQRVVAGPGNVYRCELCFLRGLDPWTPVGRVAEPEKLIALLARLFAANRETGSQITTGDARPGRERWVYGRAGRPCRRCDTPIRRREAPACRTSAEEGRLTYWCPSCQPPPAGPSQHDAGGS